MWGWASRYRRQKATVTLPTAEEHCEQMRQGLRQLRADLVTLHDELAMAADDIDSLLRRLNRQHTSPPQTDLLPVTLTANHHQR